VLISESVPVNVKIRLPTCLVLCKLCKKKTLLEENVGKPNHYSRMLLNAIGSIGETTVQLVISESRLINQIPTTENSLPPLNGKSMRSMPKNQPNGSKVKPNLKKHKRSLSTSMLLLKRWLTISQFIQEKSLDKLVLSLKTSLCGLSQLLSVILTHSLNAFPPMDKLSPVLHQLINSWDNAPSKPSANLTLIETSEHKISKLP